MGLGSLAAGLAIDAAAKEANLKQLLRGRTPDQKNVIKYFYGSRGCFGFLSKRLSDEEYEGMVMAKAKSMDFKKKALAKIGLDESQVNEVVPIHFENYLISEDTDIGKRGKDGVWRSTEYQISWIFFSSTQVYVYQYTFNMANDEKAERTEEYFYKDITNFSTTSDTIEIEEVKVSCTGSAKYLRTRVDSNRFALVVPGDKFYCAMKQNDYTEKAIQGMKAKLREKKA